jgi:peptidoglycan/LPS O-acetylase OafA/YrhL
MIGGSGTLRAMANSPPSGSSHARVDELDGLRGLLALWVALAHILAWTGHWENPLPGRLEGVWKILVSADPAVDTFIILSGFAISFLIHKRSQSYGAFMRGRVFRIYPVYLTCLALSIATSFLTPGMLDAASWKNTIYFEWLRMFHGNETSAFGSHVFWHVTLLNGLLTKDFLPGANATFLPPAWSITLEWQYYLVAPFLARGVRSGTGLLLIGLVAWLGHHFAAPWHNTQLSFLPAQLPLFLVGIGSYHFYAGLSQDQQLRKPTSIHAAALLLVAGLCGWHSVALAAWALGFGCILVRGDDPLARLLALIRRTLLHPWLQHLGKVSFPLYLIHWPVIILLLTGLLRIFPDISRLHALIAMIAMGLPLILVAAEIIHRLIEKPGMDFGKKFDRR